MEVRLSQNGRCGVLRHLHAQQVLGGVRAGAYGIEATGGYAPAAPHACSVIDHRFLVREGYRAVGACLQALPASSASPLIDQRLLLGVLLHLAPAGGAPHAQVLHCPANSRELVAFEMAQGDDDIGLGHSPSDLRFANIFSVYRHQGLIGALQTVPYQDLASCGEGAESVGVCGIQMLHGVLPASCVQCVAVGQERYAPFLPDQIGQYLGIVGP